MDEIIRLEVDQEDVARAAEKGNRALESVEKQADRTGAAVANSLDQAGQATVRIIDNSLRSNRRLAEDAVKQANKIGSTGVQQAEARRDAILKKIGGDPVNTEIVIEAYKKIIAHERELEAQIRRTAQARAASASNQGELARIQQAIRLREQQSAATAAAAAKAAAAENDIRVAAERAEAAFLKERAAIEAANVALERRAQLAGKTPIERVQIEGKNAVADARAGGLTDQDIQRRAAAYARLAEVQRQADNSALLAKAQAGSARAARASEDFAKALNQVNAAAHKEREAIEQETRALERRAQVIGKTGVQRAAIEGNRAVADLAARGATPEQLQRVTKAHEELIAAQRNLQGSNASVGQSLINLAGQLGLVVSAAAAVKFVFKDAILDSALYAARTEQLGVALTAVTRANGLAEVTIGGLEARIKKLGITTQETRGALSRLIAGGIDTNKAEQLARLAQNVGRVAGIPSSDAFERIVHAVITLQPELFKYLGLNVSLEQAYKRVAAEQGRQVASFTELEKRNIALNEALIVGASYNGVYEDSLNTAGGQILSFDRYIKEARNSLGNELLPTLTAAVTLLNSLGKGGETAGEILGQLIKRSAGEVLFPGFGRFIPDMIGAVTLMQGKIDDLAATPGKSLKALDKQIESLAKARAAALKNVEATGPGNIAELERIKDLEGQILDLRKQRINAQVEDKIRGLSAQEKTQGLTVIAQQIKAREDAIEKEKDAREKLVKAIAAAEKDARRDLQQAQAQEAEGLERIQLQHRFTLANLREEGLLTKSILNLRKQILEANLRIATAAAISKAESFREQSIAKELDGLERIAEIRRKGIEEVKKEKLAPSKEAEAIAIRQEGIDALIDKHHADVLKKSEDFLHQSTKQEADGFDKIAEIQRKELEAAKGYKDAIANVNAGILALEKKLTDDLAQELARRIDQRALLTADAERDTQLRGVQLLEAQTLEVGSQNDVRILAQKVQLEQAKTAIVQDHILKRAQLELQASIEQETRDVNAAEGLKQKNDIAARAGAQRREIEQKSEIAFDASREELVIRTANLIRDQQQRIFDSIRQSAEGLFDSMLQGAKSFGDALKRVMLAALLTPVKQAFSNAVATMLTGMQTAQTSAVGPGTGGSAGLFGKLGTGVLFGGGGFSLPGAPGGTPGFAGPVQMGATDVASGIPSFAAQIAGGGTATGGPVGFKLGNPIGAAIGTSAGAVAGIARLFIKGAEDKIVEKVKRIYGVSISKKFARDPLLGIVKQNFGGNLEVGLRSPQVRELVELYSMSFGKEGGGGGGFRSAAGGIFGKAGLGGLLGGLLGGGSGEFNIPGLSGAPGGTGGFAGPVTLGSLHPASGRGIFSPLSLPLSGLGTGFGLPGAPGGTTGINGPVGGGGSAAQTAGFAAQFAGLKKSLTQLGNIGFKAGGKGVGGAAGGGLLLGGGALAFDGLRRGGALGLAQTTAGGALIGFKFGGPIGAAIGAGVGAAAGTIRLFIKGATDKVVEKTKAIYGITISKSFAKDPLLGIIKQNFGGNLEVGLRSPQVRELIELYAMSTGQERGGVLAPKVVQSQFTQRGGSISAAPVFNNGALIKEATKITTANLPDLSKVIAENDLAIKDAAVPFQQIAEQLNTAQAGLTNSVKAALPRLAINLSQPESINLSKVGQENTFTVDKTTTFFRSAEAQIESVQTSLTNGVKTALPDLAITVQTPPSVAASLSKAALSNVAEVSKILKAFGGTGVQLDAFQSKFAEIIQAALPEMTLRVVSTSNPVADLSKIALVNSATVNEAAQPFLKTSQEIATAQAELANSVKAAIPDMKIRAAAAPSVDLSKAGLTNQAAISETVKPFIETSGKIAALHAGLSDSVKAVIPSLTLRVAAPQAIGLSKIGPVNSTLVAGAVQPFLKTSEEIGALQARLSGDVKAAIPEMTIRTAAVPSVELAGVGLANEAAITETTKLFLKTGEEFGALKTRLVDQVKASVAELSSTAPIPNTADLLGDVAKVKLASDSSRLRVAPQAPQGTRVVVEELQRQMSASQEKAIADLQEFASQIGTTGTGIPTAGARFELGVIEATQRRFEADRLAAVGVIQNRLTAAHEVLTGGLEKQIASGHEATVEGMQRLASAIGTTGIPSIEARFETGAIEAKQKRFETDRAAAITGLQERFGTGHHDVMERFQQQMEVVQTSAVAVLQKAVSVIGTTAVPAIGVRLEAGVLETSQKRFEAERNSAIGKIQERSVAVHANALGQLETQIEASRATAVGGLQKLASMTDTVAIPSIETRFEAGTIELAKKRFEGERAAAISMVTERFTSGHAVVMNGLEKQLASTQERAIAEVGGLAPTNQPVDSIRSLLSGQGTRGGDVYSNAELHLPQTVSMAPLAAPPAPAPTQDMAVMAGVFAQSIVKALGNQPVTFGTAQISINGEGAKAALEGYVAPVVERSPEAVSNAQLRATRNSTNRRQQTALAIAPGMITG